MRMRRTALAVLTVGLAVAGAVGCTAAPGTAPWPRPPAGMPTITILSGTDTSISAGNEPVKKGEPGMYQELVDWWNRYEAPLRHVRVRLDVIPGGATLEHSEMLAAAETGSTSYDVFNLDSEWVPEFAAGGYIRSLQGRLPVSGFLAKPLASGEDPSGRLYAAPFTTDVGLLYYRDDLVTAAEAASLHTFTQVMHLAQRTIRQQHTAGPTEEYAGQFAEYEGLTVNVLEMIRGYSYNQPAFAADGTIKNPSAVSATLEELVDMFSGSQLPGAELSYQEAQAFSAFATGQALFMRNWPIYYEELKADDEPGRADYVAHHFAVVPLPFPSVLGGQDLAISAHSRDPSQALEVVEFLTSAAAERCLFAVGGFPATRKTAYATTGSLPSGYGQVHGHRLCGNQAGGSVHIGPTILRALARAIPRPDTRYYTEFSTVIQDDVWPMLSLASQGGSLNVASVVTALTNGLNAAASGRAPPP
jgi:multiple sugar transport system substrate-binding protein